MDVREFRFWAEEAARTEAERGQMSLIMGRISMHATLQAFGELLEKLRSAAMTPEERQEAIEATWAKLREAGKVTSGL